MDDGVSKDGHLDELMWASVCDLLHATSSPPPPPQRFEEVDTASPNGEDAMWASVCNVLHRTPPSVQLPPSRPPSTSKDEASMTRKPKRHRVYTNKGEVARLEAEIQDLQKQLLAAKRVAKEDTCAWERAAAQQRVEKIKSIQVNNDLHAAVRERSDFIDRLQKLTKPPRWTALPDANAAAWNETMPLPADPARRAAAIHSLADHLYKRYETTLIQAGALNLRDDMCRCEPVTLRHQELGFRSVNHLNMPAPFQLMATACWRVLSGDEPMPTYMCADEINVWERLDQETSYERFQATQHGQTCHSNILRKWFETDDRVVIVWRTVVDDALVTRQPGDIVDDACGWWTFSKHADDATKSYMTIVTQSNITRLLESHDAASTDPEDVIAAIEKLVVSKAAPSDEAPSPPSFLLAFIERGRRLRPIMRRVIEQAIRDHGLQTNTRSASESG
ncbi:Aste57867_19617 [Aphanomyces stellatus]|uniref:Aste57867_19617 protein n=1 Tax=Aphanomyces stellatus TaxID=120398 RepID=A0A485LDM9_9STRA|nr:hypothetical protein As57867_019553 [Aphanomyces stellatus]VFT96317.1 Aste57867_19617 [Aphanomyces stellatus]